MFRHHLQNHEHQPQTLSLNPCRSASITLSKWLRCGRIISVSRTGWTISCVTDTKPTNILTSTICYGTCYTYDKLVQILAKDKKLHYESDPQVQSASSPNTHTSFRNEQGSQQGLAHPPTHPPLFTDKGGEIQSTGDG